MVAAKKDHPHSTTDWALYYVGLGYRVLPVHPEEKRPYKELVPHGSKNASSDPKVIASWWEACPEAGVGLLPPEGVLVLDVDEEEAWERLKEEHPVLLEAPRQRTPKGGRHVFLRLPDGVRLSSTVRALKGVDLRGMSSTYVVAAPTRWKDGWGYRWEVPLVRPEELPLVPDELLLKLLPPPPPPRDWTPAEGVSPRRLRAYLEAYARQVEGAPVGTRHNTLIRYAVAAGGLIPHGLDPREAEEVLVAAAMRSGLPEREARDAARWGLEKGEKRPLPLEERPLPPQPSPKLRFAKPRLCYKPRLNFGRWK
ncbi:hypothetical protein TthHB5008_17640 [Thermus thermophilus]|uniref:bifunctional DNA primase/polymerase n=1 Tax=Thermus thermophilus TaxID=274 RepID=UPI00195098F0|nr:bifunctional DNA primase/polymerase [Thermus thermophilus]BCP98665.1 hypothetical protein TthHB5002_17680 [Thermus thermophilus]BCQ00994.1 hypothetical protein TthHB5008_17640 [Thermus thermophilus]